LLTLVRFDFICCRNKPNKLSVTIGALCLSIEDPTVEVPEIGFDDKADTLLKIAINGLAGPDTILGVLIPHVHIRIV